MENLSPPPKKMENPKIQPINADVINLLKTQGKKEESPEIAQTKERLLKIMKTAGISPQTVIQAANYANQALKNPKMYPVAIQMAIKEKLINPSDVQKGGVDYKLLASGITAGKLVQELMQEGKL